jgi:glucose-1-phosphate adenylyltransferase
MNKSNLSSIHLSKMAVALVLAGGRGSRLYDLTAKRAKPSVYFGGKFRIIDFVLSNCINSGIRKIGVVTQYKSHSLIRHVQRGWGYMRGELNEFIDLLPAQQRINEEFWYRGTADAIYQNIDILKSYRSEYFIILAGDHIYKMDYSLMLQDHVKHNLGCTIGCISVPKEEAYAFGVMQINQERMITDFVEKPANPPTIPDNPNISLASMGIYIFNADYLYQLLEEDIANKESSHDFGKDIIPKVVQQGQALAHPFELSCVPKIEKPYWRDVGTIDSFWSANLDLASNLPELNLYDPLWPIWTKQEQLPPAKCVPDRNGVNTDIANTLISGGCIVNGSKLINSIIFSNIRIESFCQIRDCVILPNVLINEDCRLTKVIIDRGCVIPRGFVIGENPELDAARFFRSNNGVVLVTREMLMRINRD